MFCGVTGEPVGVGSVWGPCPAPLGFLWHLSQWFSSPCPGCQVNTVVSGALDRLHYEKDPCVKYDIGRKLWIYLHRDRSEEEFGVCPASPGRPDALSRPHPAPWHPLRTPLCRGTEPWLSAKPPSFLSSAAHSCPQSGSTKPKQLQPKPEKPSNRSLSPRPRW